MFKRINNWVYYTAIIISFTDSVSFVKYIIKNYFVLGFKHNKHQCKP